MKVICIANQKGGVAKTATSAILASVLKQKGNRVLAIDMDPQGSLSKQVGATTEGHEVYEGLKGNASARDAIQPLERFDILPTSIILAGLEAELMTDVGKYFKLRDAIDEAGLKDDYDYIIIDTNPGLGLVNQNAFFAADSIVLVTDVSDNGLTGVEMFQYLWGEELCTELRIPDVTKGLVVCNYDKRIKLAPEMLDYIRSREDMGGLLVDTVIPYRVAYKDTEVESKPINLEHPKSNEHTILEAVVKDLRKKGAI